MAEEQYRDDLERSEEPTAKRRDEARKKGQVAKSRLVIPAATLLAIALGLRFGGAELIARFERLFVGFFTISGAAKPLGREDLFALSLEAGFLVGPVLLPLFGGIIAAGVGGGMLQTGFVFSTEPLQFDLSRLNPMAGLRRLFTLDAAFEFVKALAAVIALGTLGFVYLCSDLPTLTALTSFQVEDLLAYATTETLVVIGLAATIISAFAAADYFYQRWRVEKQLRMSRHEVKEELREQEGDPQLKGRLKTLRQKMSKRRMMAEIPKADVIITNPTELAVAVRYRFAEMSAPKVVAKGGGYIAEKIREIGRQSGVPIVENKPLARLLFQQVEVGQEIPANLYRAVAEVLAYVYRLRRGAQKIQPERRPEP